MTLFESSLYKQAAERVRFRLEEASKQEVEIFGQPWWQKHFVYGAAPHTLSTFKTILGKMHLTIAASTIDGKSAEPLRMNQGFESIEQSMFTHAHAFKLESDQIREMIMMVNTATDQNRERVVDYITNTLWGITKEAVNGVHARLDLIILSALSNAGKFTFTADNDPQSPFVGKTIDFGMNASHIAQVGSGNEWNEGNKNIIDPLTEIDDVISNSLVGIEKILLDRQTMNYIRKTQAMQKYINSSLYPNKPLSDAMVNDWMSANGYPTFEVVERKIAIQNGDALSTVSPWKAGQLVFIPQNQIGTIETRQSDAELGMPSDGVTYSHYGRIEVRKFTQGERENSNYCEITKASITAAPSMDTIDNIFVLDTTK